jgi:hypothetical protein
MLTGGVGVPVSGFLFLSSNRNVDMGQGVKALQCKRAQMFRNAGVRRWWGAGWGSRRPPQARKFRLSRTVYLSLLTKGWL